MGPVSPLARQALVDGRDIRAGIDDLGMLYKDFAAKVSISPDWLAAVMHGRESASPRLNLECRRAFGLQFTKADEMLRDSKRKGPGGDMVSDRRAKQ